MQERVLTATEIAAGLDLLDDIEDVAPAQPAVLRDDKGRILPGSASIGGGRCKGPSNSEKLRALVTPEMEATVARLFELAYQKDDPHAAIRAIEVILAYIAPKPKMASEKVVVEGFATAPTLQAKAEAVITAAANGEISAEAAEKLLKIIDAYNRAIATTEVEKRMKALESGGKHGRVIEGGAD